MVEALAVFDTRPRSFSGIFLLRTNALCSNVRQLGTSLFATHYIRNHLASPARYFAHLQPTVRFLYLSTWLKNPWDLIVFVPLLGDVTIEMLGTHSLPPLLDSEPEGTEQLKSHRFEETLRLRQIRRPNTFILELVKSRVQYHTFSFRETTVWTGIQELIVVCGSMLRVLDFSTHSASSSRSSLPQSKRNS